MDNNSTKTLIEYFDTETPVLWAGKRLISNPTDSKATLLIALITEKTITEIKNKNGTEIYQRIPQSTLPGFAKGGAENVAASLILRGCSQASKENQERVGTKECNITDTPSWQEKQIKYYSENEGNWFSNADEAFEKNFELIGEGGESRVYIPKEEKADFVIKVISSIYYEYPELLLDRVTLHNYLFPETAMMIKGFGYDKYDNFCIITKQPFIKGEHLSKKEIDNHIEKLGFERNQYLVINDNDFLSPFIALGDMHDENILRTPEYNFAVIDCDIRLNTPNLGYNGKWIIPDIENTNKETEQFDKLITRALSTKTSIRTLCKDILGKDVPHSLTRKINLIKNI